MRRMTQLARAGLCLSLACSGPNGADGAPGALGEPGLPGEPGQDGAEGAPGALGERGLPGEPGEDGAPGEDGEPGEDGAPGASWSTGDGEPEPSDGREGDFYLDTSSLELYAKTASGWQLVGSIQGERGEEGEPGAAGASWLSGNGAPGNDLGQPDDVFFDRETSNLYQKGISEWTLIGNLQGAPGDDGATWLSGAGAPAGALGNLGDLYLDEASGTLYEKGAVDWEIIADLQPGGATLGGYHWSVLGDSGLGDGLQFGVLEENSRTQVRATVATLGAWLVLDFGAPPRVVDLSSSTNLEIYADIPSGSTFGITLSGTPDPFSPTACVWDVSGIGAPKRYFLNLGAPRSCARSGSVDDVLERVARIFIYNPAEEPTPITITGVKFVDRYEL